AARARGGRATRAVVHPVLLPGVRAEGGSVAQGRRRHGRDGGERCDHGGARGGRYLVIARRQSGEFLSGGQGANRLEARHRLRGGGEVRRATQLPAVLSTLM